uniref:Uncharacterized protein n=1 Tax=Nymphaea colorata TaxID=210225 RepID=A0A5K1E977_9MAGN
MEAMCAIATEEKNRTMKKKRGERDRACKKEDKKCRRRKKMLGSVPISSQRGSQSEWYRKAKKRTTRTHCWHSCSSLASSSHGWRAKISEFMATFLFPYITIYTIMHESQNVS